MYILVFLMKFSSINNKDQQRDNESLKLFIIFSNLSQYHSRLIPLCQFYGCPLPSTIILHCWGLSLDILLRRTPGLISLHGDTVNTPLGAATNHLFSLTTSRFGVSCRATSNPPSHVHQFSTTRVISIRCNSKREGHSPPSCHRNNSHIFSTRLVEPSYPCSYLCFSSFNFG